MKDAGLDYVTAGSGGIPVAFLHGIGGNTDSFQPQLDGLNGTLYGLNLPGYGQSVLLTELTFPNLAASLVQWLDALQIEKVHLCGQSIGGMIAIETACLYPERVGSLVLIATTSAFGGRDDSFKDAFLAARLAPLDAGKTLAELATEFVPEIVGTIAQPDAIASATGSMATVPEATYRAVLQCLVTFDRRDDIAKIAVPTCLIAGAEDQNAPAKTMARMAEKMPDAEYHEIAGAGHLVNLEAPVETNRILSTFYGRLS
ncbi:MAG: alpha/beta hydrolase [Pseudomonadota bacterium]